MRSAKILESEGWEPTEETKKARINRESTLALNNSAASIATSVEKIAKVSGPADNTEIAGMMNRLIGELEKIANVKGWQKIGMHFQRDKQGVISDAIIERLK